MKRNIIIAGIIVLLIIPIVLLVFQRVQITSNNVHTWPLVSQTPVPDRYSATSQASGYTIKITDTKFLDYVANNVGIFKPDAVVDPGSYKGATHHYQCEVRVGSGCSVSFGGSAGKVLKLPSVVDIPAYPVQIHNGIIFLGAPKE